MRLALVGLPGSGKSTVGKLLAKRLSLPFLDSDEEIERRAKMEIRTFFECKGEGAFRDLECEVIGDLCKAADFVLSTGGGAVTRSQTRELLVSRCTVVYLKANADSLWKRLKNDTRRPLLQSGDGRQRLADLATVRGPLYESTANYVIETGHSSVQTTVNMIAMQMDLAAIGDHPEK